MTPQLIDFIIGNNDLLIEILDSLKNDNNKLLIESAIKLKKRENELIIDELQNIVL